jgi:hypothetical protein
MVSNLRSTPQGSSFVRLSRRSTPPSVLPPAGRALRETVFLLDLWSQATRAVVSSRSRATGIVGTRLDHHAGGGFATYRPPDIVEPSVTAGWLSVEMLSQKGRNHEMLELSAAAVVLASMSVIAKLPWPRRRLPQASCQSVWVGARLRKARSREKPLLPPRCGSRLNRVPPNIAHRTATR